VIAYFNGSFLRKEEIHISPDDRGFLFADGVYEVVRAYSGKPFRMAEHMDCLARSLRETRIDFPGVADLVAARAQLIARNRLETTDSILYFQVTRDAVLDLCRRCGIAYKEQAFRGNALNRASEIIITGTK
jgi:D-alanine transaminase